MSYRILIVDDDLVGLSATKMLLERHGYLVDTAHDAEVAVEAVRRGVGQYALVILDYRLPDGDGARVAERLLAIRPDLYVLIYSGHPSCEAIKSSWHAGAVGFLEKSSSIDTFLSTVRNWCRKFEQTYVSATLEGGEAAEAIARIGLIGRSRAMARVAERVQRYATKMEHVLILGETGTGKERIARALHSGTPESFFPVNCASFSGGAELMESDLFGYVRGAFTGATQDRQGVFESARGGTIFLDEIDTLDRKAQQKLLRVIQEKTVRPLGSAREYPVSFRLVCAAKPEIETAVQAGGFLPDLFERLNVLRIDVPPLRERVEDIEPLVAYFCRKYEKETGERKAFLKRTVQYLEGYSWPRNVRELENTVRRLCIDCGSDRIAPEHLEAKFFSQENGPSVRSRLDDVLRKEVQQALERSASQREAARRLGMPESSLRNFVRRLGIRAATGRGRARGNRQP